MFITSVYHYVPRQLVTVLTIDSVRKYAPVYSKPLVLHKGVENKLSFQFLNNEQKPINLTDNNIILRIIDSTGKKILLEKELDQEFALTGIASLNVLPDDIESIDSQKAFYSLEIIRGNNHYPVYLAKNTTARGEMSIIDSILPSFVPSDILTIPTIAEQTVFPANYLSSVYNSDSLVTTFQVTLNDYTGTFTIEGSSQSLTSWYEIDTYSYTATTGTVGITVKGYHSLIRIQFNSTQGIVTNILAR